VYVHISQLTRDKGALCQQCFMPLLLLAHSR
jgi:hypothetical protein